MVVYNDVFKWDCNNLFKYVKIEKLPKEVFNATYIWFFRHKGLYMCHAFLNNIEYRFWLTEKNEHLTKRQARNRIHEMFPKAFVELKVIPRSNVRERN